jgi:Tol biopolymer transport system component
MLSTKSCFGFIIILSMMFFCFCNCRDTLIDVNSGNDLISFNSDRSGNDEIYIMDINSHNVRQLTNNTVADYWPSWSQDGEWIAYSSVQDGNWDIYPVFPILNAKIA